MSKTCVGAQRWKEWACNDSPFLHDRRRGDNFGGFLSFIDDKKSFRFLLYVFRNLLTVFILSAAGRIYPARGRTLESRIWRPDRHLSSVQVAAAILLNLVEIDKSMLARQNGR